MSLIQRLFATAAMTLSLIGAIMLFSAPSVPAQGPVDEDQQRQIFRLDRDLREFIGEYRADKVVRDRLAFEGFSRLAGVERELELDRRIIYGLGLTLLGQLALSGLTLRRLNGVRR